MWKSLLKIAVSGLILYLLFREIHWFVLAPYFQQIYIGWFVLAILALFMSSLIAAWRWAMIMKSLAFQAPWSFYIKSYLKGVMFNQILPTSVGGDAYRMLEVAGLGRGKKAAILGVLVDRVYGSVGLIILNLLALGFAYHLIPALILNIIIGVSITAVLGIGVLISLAYLPAQLIPRGFGFVIDLAKQLIHSADSWRDFWLKALLAVMPNFLTVVTFFLLAQSLHVSGNLVAYLIIVPSILLLTMIPISLAGWGVREGAMVYLGGLVGIIKPEALAISLLFGLILILNGMPGLAFYLKSMHPLRKVNKVHD